MSLAASWLDSDRELLVTVRRIHDLFSPEECREWLLGQFQEYVVQRNRGEKAEPEWKSQRRAYFETEVFKPGMSKLRDRTIVPSEKLVWAKHSRELEPGEANSVSATLKRSSFTTFDLRNGEEVPRRVVCFERAFGRDCVYVQAWTPVELEAFDTRRKCHIPLPPEDIGRPYTDAEICMGLAILHDGAGTFTALIPSDGELGAKLGTERFWMTALAKGIEDYPKTGAKESWPLRMEPLIDRIKAVVAPPSEEVWCKNVTDPADIPAEFRDGGCSSGEPLTAKLTSRVEKYDLNGPYLTKYYSGPRYKLGRNYVYRYKEISALSGQKTFRAMSREA